MDWLALSLASFTPLGRDILKGTRMRQTTEEQVREYLSKNAQDNQAFAVSLRLAIPAGISAGAAYAAFGHFILMPFIRVVIG